MPTWTCCFRSAENRNDLSCSSRSPRPNSPLSHQIPLGCSLSNFHARSSHQRMQIPVHAVSLNLHTEEPLSSLWMDDAGAGESSLLGQWMFGTALNRPMFPGDSLDSIGLRLALAGKRFGIPRARIRGYASAFQSSTATVRRRVSCHLLDGSSTL
jgi:hypothetical protein